MALLPLLFVLLLPGQAASGPTDRDRCQSILMTRQLAAEEGLPVSPTLDALEQRYCAAPRSAEPQTPAAQDAPVDDPCFELWFATELAFIGGGRALGDDVDALRAAVCAAGELTERTRYTTGVLVRSAAGTLRYPNSAVARSQGGVWRYPNGTRARSLDDVWRYPNGVRARSTRGVWSDPRGRSYRNVTDMLLAVCRDKRDVCQPTLDAMTGWEGDARTLGLLRVAWDAYLADKAAAKKVSAERR